MRTGDDDTTTGWCFAVTSMCSVVGSTGSLLLDSGSDEHLCTPKFADLTPTNPNSSPFKLKNVQQNDLAISGQKPCPRWWDRQVASMPWRQRPHSELLRCVTTFCRWENWCEKVCSLWVLVAARWKRTAGKCRYTFNESVCVWRLMLERASRPRYVAAGTAVTDELMDGVDMKKSRIVECRLSCGTIS